MTRKY